MYAKGKKAAGICDRCGTEHKLSRLKFQVIAGRTTKLRVCPDCLDIDHPGNRPERFARTGEAIAVKDPRPDLAEAGMNSLWGWGPVLGCEIPIFPTSDGFTQRTVVTPAPVYLLTEDGNRILYEDGDFITLETP